MISQSIRAMEIQQKRTPSIFIYQNSPMGIFNITGVEAEVKSKLDAVSWICLSLANTFGKVSRIEIHAISGIDEKLIQNHLDQLATYSLLETISYDEQALNKNIKRIDTEIGSDWKTTSIKAILSRNLLRQFTISNTGKEAIKDSNKTVIDSVTLDLAISGTPFHIFNAKLNPRANTYQEIEMDPELISKVVSLAKDKKDVSGINPLSISSNSVALGKSITTSQIWVSLSQKDSSLSTKKSDKNIFLTSATFDRWATPEWDESILDTFPEYGSLKDIVVSAISNSYDMLEEIILDSLKLDSDGITWTLEVDLEMAMFINKRDSDLIKYTKTEVSLDLPNTKWRISIILQLEPYYESEEDLLALRALRGARFHILANRRGFNSIIGYKLFKDIMKKWDKKSDMEDYKNTLSDLVEYGCLIEKMPKIQELIVDLDNILNQDRRGSQQWNFHRITQLEKILDNAKIDKITYVASDKFNSKLDDKGKANKWKKSVILSILEDSTNKLHPAISKAQERGCHYLGNRHIPKTKELKEMRIKSRQIRFKINKNNLSISDLDPFFEWRMENLFEVMYKEFY